MKTIHYLYLSSLAALATLAGCNNDGSPELPSPAPEKVEIRLGGSVALPATPQGRGVVSDGQYLTAMLIAREGTDEAGYAAATQAWTASGSFYADAATGQEIGIVPKQYYSNTDGHHTYILGVYPSGTLQGGKVTFARTDGEQDVMISGWTDAGTKATQPATAATLAFGHKTAQIYFEAQALPNSDEELFSEPAFVQSITLRDAQVPRGVDITVPVVEFAEPASLAIPGMPTVGLSATPTACGNPVMVNSSALLVVDIVLNVGGTPMLFDGVTLKDAANPDMNLATETGKRHKVTLSFTAPDDDPTGAVRVNATATVASWEEGSSGSVIL